MKRFVLALLVAAGTIGCVNQRPEAPPPKPPDEPAVSDPLAAQFVQRVKEDLSQRIGIPTGQIHLLQVEELLWPDASLGCPQPDHFYAQVITPGYKIVLRANDRTYPYHTDKQERVVLCEREQ